MKKVGLVALFAACVAVFPTQAQGFRIGGRVLNQDLMISSDFAALSQTHAFGTARSMAMGGAFTSLGADMVSLSLNPAGLGMYRRSEISFTPMVTLSNADTPGTNPWQENNKSRFAFANIGAAINLFESASRTLTSVTLGFGMNRVADFNTRYSFSSESLYNPANPGHLMPTLADVFSQQLNAGGIFPDKEGYLGYNLNPYYWASVLGYNGYMVSPIDGVWTPDTIGANASVLHSMDVVSSGSINEFSLSFGANISNIIYVGASLGIQSVHKKLGITYQEEYGYFDAQGRPTMAVTSSGAPLESQLNYSNLYQQVVLDGSGVNFKMGVIVRPTTGLRIGLAVHTPTFYSLDRTYRGNIESGLNGQSKTNYDETKTQVDEGSNSWQFVSPTRVMLGASYTFGQFAIVSVDYERDWYNGIRVKNVPQGADFSPEYYKQEFKANFCGTNTLRAGVEVKPLPILALRVGGGFTSSMLQDGMSYVDAPIPTDSYYITAGLGVNLSRSTTLDFGYQYVNQNNSSYQLFYSADKDGPITESGLYDTKLMRHYISMTLGFRF